MQYLEREDKISSLEIEVEEVRNELQGKVRLLGDYQDQVNDLKVELASVREQKNSAMKEVCCAKGWFVSCLIREKYYLLNYLWYTML